MLAAEEKFPGVAGVQAPAFVERIDTRSGRGFPGCVAGVQAPAFVERADPGNDGSSEVAVSPEFRLRPLLSESHLQLVHEMARRVAGVQAPAFVERPCLRIVSLPSFGCRRSSGSGLC